MSRGRAQSTHFWLVAQSIVVEIKNLASSPGTADVVFREDFD